jgi:hypothetical protein
VTLKVLPQKEVNEQVLWLANLLSPRGLPTFLTQRQLELLHRELVESVPERADQYARFQAAARMLAEARARLLAPSEFNALADEFERTTEALPSRLANCGAMIISAVIDERSSIKGALEALISWLTDRARFDEAWIACVEQLVERVEAKIA